MSNHIRDDDFEDSTHSTKRMRVDKSENNLISEGTKEIYDGIKTILPFDIIRIIQTYHYTIYGELVVTIPTESINFIIPLHNGNFLTGGGYSARANIYEVLQDNRKIINIIGKILLPKDIIYSIIPLNENKFFILHGQKKILSLYDGDVKDFSFDLHEVVDEIKILSQHDTIKLVSVGEGNINIIEYNENYNPKICKKSYDFPEIQKENKLIIVSDIKFIVVSRYSISVFTCEDHEGLSIRTYN